VKLIKQLVPSKDAKISQRDLMKGMTQEQRQGIVFCVETGHALSLHKTAPSLL